MNFKRLRVSGPPPVEPGLHGGGMMEGPGKASMQSGKARPWFAWLGIQNQLPNLGFPPLFTLQARYLCPGWVLVHWDGIKRVLYPPFLKFFGEVLETAPAGNYHLLLADFNAQRQRKLKGEDWNDCPPPWTDLVCGRKVEYWRGR